MECISAISISGKDIDEYCDILHDYSFRFEMIESTYNGLCGKLQDFANAVNNIRVSHNLENAKVVYQMILQLYHNELYRLHLHMKRFPSLVENQFLIALASKEQHQKTKCRMYFDSILTNYNISIVNLDRDINMHIERGIHLYNVYQNIHCKNCRGFNLL